MPTYVWKARLSLSLSLSLSLPPLSLLHVPEANDTGRDRIQKGREGLQQHRENWDRYAISSALKTGTPGTLLKKVDAIDISRRYSIPCRLIATES